LSISIDNLAERNATFVGSGAYDVVCDINTGRGDSVDRGETA
jgi:hypothetical protein